MLLTAAVAAAIVATTGGVAPTASEAAQRNLIRISAAERVQQGKTRLTIRYTGDARLDRTVRMSGYWARLRNCAPGSECGVFDVRKEWTRTITLDASGRGQVTVRPNYYRTPAADSRWELFKGDVYLRVRGTNLQPAFVFTARRGKQARFSTLNRHGDNVTRQVRR
jgi:hypothetical protein